MSFTPIVSTDKFTMAKLNEKFTEVNDSLQTEIDSIAFPKIVTGSYVGTGTSGVNNPNTLIFPFKPALVIIQSNPGNASYTSNTGATILYGCRALRLWDRYGASVDANLVTWNDLTMSWYTANASYQLNSDGLTYQYFAIG